MSEWFGDFGGFEARFNPVHALERGELEVPDFEGQLARRLTRRDGQPVVADGSRSPHVQPLLARTRHGRTGSSGAPPGNQDCSAVELVG